jgi:ubiquitin carboxyl-terminal hydrolase 5/13
MTKGVMDAMSAKKQSDIKAWEEETLQSCYHADSLMQVENVQVSGKCNFD